jgi:flagellar hook-basal body complex protein FliE
VIVTDLNVPGADGFDVVRAARGASPSVYVVMITGYATIDTAVGAVREGTYDLQRAEMTLQLTVQIRNKLVHAYQGVMRMLV